MGGNAQIESIWKGRKAAGLRLAVGKCIAKDLIGFLADSIAEVLARTFLSVVGGFMGISWTNSLILKGC